MVLQQFFLNYSGVKPSDLKKLLKEMMGNLKNPVREFSLHDPKNAQIKESVSWIKFGSATNTFKCIKAASDDDDVIYSKSNMIKSPDVSFIDIIDCVLCE